MKAQNVALKDKEYLNPQEAIKHWNLSNRKFYSFLKKGPYSFIAYYGTRKLILRAAFDKYLIENPRIREELTNGIRKNSKRF
ncbi:MAG: DNA-binding protein [Lachnospiraceae bacterium]|nr:DNA-binding protein [Lachnospiraceae bacterium]